MLTEVDISSLYQVSYWASGELCIIRLGHLRLVSWNLQALPAWVDSPSGRLYDLLLNSLADTVPAL